MSNSQQPIAVDEAYNIRDNQFWYNDCSFRHLIEGKGTIIINIEIEGLGTLVLNHSELGHDGRTTYSYKLPTDVQDRWKELQGKIVRVELISVEEKSGKEQQPIATDETYRIRDNQFWYNDCRFSHLIEDKETIVVNIEGLGIRTLMHSKKGEDGRTTYSYKLPTTEDRKWWEEHRGKIVRVELLIVE